MARALHIDLYLAPPIKAGPQAAALLKGIAADIDRGKAFGPVVHPRTGRTVGRFWTDDELQRHA